MIVVVSTELAINYTVTYGGAAVTLLRSDCSGTACQYIYYRINPAASGAIAADAVPDDWNTARVLAFTYSDVDQATPLGANSGTNGTPASSPWSLSNSITPTNSSSVLLLVSNMQSGGCAPTSSTTSLGTKRYTNHNSINNTHGEVIADYAPGTSGTPVSFNHTYTCSTGGASKFEIAAVELLPAAPAGTATSTSTITPTSTRTVTPTPTRTITPSITPSPSTSPTPSMPLVKSSNISSATIGETITFCIAYTNNSSATQTINIWDTISSYLTYVGCNTSCTQSGSLVRWSIASVAANTGGSVCFWGTVNGYPFMPELLQQQVAMLRQEDLEFLFGSLAAKGRAD